jgi:hypothetical protein
VSDQLWIYWATIAPVTIAVMVLWYAWLASEVWIPGTLKTIVLRPIEYWRHMTRQFVRCLERH